MIGWSTEFPWVRFETFLRQHPNMILVERRDMSEFENPHWLHDTLSDERLRTEV